MKAKAMITRLTELLEQHGDHDVLIDVRGQGLIPIGEIDLDVEENGFILWEEE